MLSNHPSGVGVACLEGKGRGGDSFEAFRQPIPSFDTTLRFAFYYFHRSLKYLSADELEVRVSGAFGSLITFFSPQLCRVEIEFGVLELRLACKVA